MKRLLAALALLFALAPLPIAAQNDALWRMQSFDAQVNVQKDGHVEVVETIEADFLQPRHGIFRYVPYQGKDDSGQPYKLGISLKSVMRDGAEEKVQTAEANDNIVWKIGDADRTLTGSHTYILTYDVVGALRGFDNFDEIYWNVTGNGWDTTLPSISATFMLPEGVSATQSACYTGAYGSTEKDCAITSEDNGIWVASEASEPLTVAVGFPKGQVEILSLKETPLSPLGYVFLILWFAVIPLLVPLVAFIVLYRSWRRQGVDKKFGTIVVQYEPPAGLRPAETHAVLTQTPVWYDVSATIVDMAVRGYLRIEETKTETFIKTKDHFLHLVKDYAQDPSLKPYERMLLDGLFGNAAAPATARVSKLVKEKFYQKARASTLAIGEGLANDGYFDAASMKARKKLMTAGIILLLVDVVFLGAILFVVSPLMPFCVAFTALLLIAFGWAMGRWTPKGHEAAVHTKGYKEFIGAVEKYRVPWMETQEIFEKNLPYAMVFGLGSRWAKAFASLSMIQPAWYVHSGPGVWSAVTLEKSLSGWAASMASAARPPSSRSGSGGGGFSGGGFGGGGGGSW